MKKLRLGLAVLSLSVLTTVMTPAPVIAEDVMLNPDHPDRYTVVKGDTLWDISEKFLQDPWMWPEIWQVNPQIDNPHLIYPGDVISLVYLDGRPRLQVERGPRTFKLSPQVRPQPINDAISAIPLDAIDHFLNRSRVVTQEELDSAPYVLMGGQDHLIVGAGDTLYARGDFTTDKVLVYGVYRGGVRYVDPVSGEMLGVRAQDIGAVKYRALENDVATMEVIRSSEEMRIADRLLPNEERAIDSSFFPSPPENPINGVIMTVEGGVTQVGVMNVVTINKGEREGLMPGNVLAIYKKGSTVRDRVSGENVKLPDERGGLLMVFRTFEKMSFAIVLDADRALAINDVVKNP